MMKRHWHTLSGCAGLTLAALTGASAQAPGLPPPPPDLGQPFTPPNAVPVPNALPVPMGNAFPDGKLAPNGLAGATIVTVDVQAARHPISPLIYGVAFASTAQLQALNATLNRSGGNGVTRYNWRNNSSNHAADWFFQSIPDDSAVPGASPDAFIAASKAGGAQPMVTIPTIGWVAKVGPNRAKTFGFSVAKYGPQQKTDPYNPDSGNGLKLDGKTRIVGTDPNDANVPADVNFERGWVQHLTTKWGKSNAGGVRWYFMDNEPSLWHETHRDAHPKGDTMEEYRDDVLGYGAMVKSLDPAAKVLGPEEWGWPGYFWSGADLQYRGAHGYQGQPDRDAHGGTAFLPWLLGQMKAYEAKTGRRILDVATVHIYPQGGEGGDDVSPKMELLRNRSTRSLWDPAYKDESWINDTVSLIPRLKSWVATSYPGTQTGITEYNWGAERSPSGATAQADIWGIFGREGLDLATRWTTPNADTPTFKAMQLYRNYDGQKSTFGDLSVSDRVPDPDSLSSFAAVRAGDHALTVMVVNKSLGGETPLSLALAHFAPGRAAQAWQLGANNAITRLPDVPVTRAGLSAVLPAQSVTLYVIPAAQR